MTVFAKDTTYGLEFPVKQTQEHINDKLTWEGDIDIYGLMFKNKRGDDTILEAWKGTGVQGREYTEVFVDDKRTAKIGFLEISRDISTKTATVDIICTIDLEKAYDSNIRDNELAYLQLEEIINDLYEITDFKHGIEDVFSGFKQENIKYADMQPFDAFSFTVEMAYTENHPCPTEIT